MKMPSPPPPPLLLLLAMLMIATMLATFKPAPTLAL
jgi:hypothetical protein